MKKTYIFCVLAVLLVAAIGAGAFYLTTNSIQSAESIQAELYGEYVSMRSNAMSTSLTVMEGGVVVGSYTLEQLGVLGDVLEDVDACFGEMERMEPSVFANLSIKEKTQWKDQEHSSQRSVVVDLSNLSLAPVLEDLDAMPRQEAENAYVEFVDGKFLLHDEVEGNMLQLQTVQQSLMGTLTGLTVSHTSAPQARVELTDADCYLQPEVTVANAFFDFDSMLRDSIKDMTVTVKFHNGTEVLDSDMIASLLSTTDKGKVQVKRDALWETIVGWAEKYKETKASYLLDTYVEGIKPIDILKVDYDVNGDELLATLMDELVNLKSLEVECPYYCWRNGLAFELKDHYVEVDITNQTMTYFKDGEVVVSTPIVSGATWGYPTPQGLYKVENKDTNCWLSGEDYNVHVDYWIGVIGWQIGIHDADWRTIFGGQQYVREGSHGCINTPKEAVIPIFENIEVGVPVLIHGK